MPIVSNFERIAIPTLWRRCPDARHIATINNAIKLCTPSKREIFDWYNIYAESQKLRLMFDLEIIERFINRDANILEFGSCPPILTVALKHTGYSVCGLDLAPDRFERVCRDESLSIKKVNFEQEYLPFPDNTFDVVVFNEIFEHLRINPIFTFREINRILKPQGTLLLSTSNLISLKGWWNLAVMGESANRIYDAFDKLETLGHAGHVRLYTPLEVTTFLENMGFDIRVICHRGDGWRSPSKWISAIRNAIPNIFPRLRTHFTIVATTRP